MSDTESNDSTCSGCCHTKSMCGKSLAQGVIIIGWTSVVVSSTIFILSIKYLYGIKNRESLGVVLGVLTLCVLPMVCLSVYQIIISILMLSLKKQKKPRAFLCSLWYISHLSIITLYCALFFAIAFVHFTNNELLLGIVSVIFSVAYIGVLSYFEIVVNSYLCSSDIGERYI